MRGDKKSLVIELSMNEIPVYTIHLPEYQINAEPDHDAIGAKVDDFIKKHFMGQYVAIRCLGSSEHPGKSTDEMIEIIKTLGHDRYDADRAGDRYENKEGKKIDFFAFDYTINQNSKIFSFFTWPFYHWRKEVTGAPVRIDIIILYDPTRLEQIEFTYAGREHEGARSDGFVFKDPNNKPAAIKGIIKVV